MPSHKTTIAIIGAGLSGTALARRLTDAGLACTMCEKSRGAGGRMATRRSESSLRFDHGAQYFTIRDPKFSVAAERWVQTGLIAKWEGTIVEFAPEGLIDKTNDERWVAVPGMNALCKHLAAGVPLQTGVQVAEVKLQKGGWELRSQEGASLGTADWVVSTAPAEQTAALMPESQPILQATSRAEMLPCWAAMIAPGNPLSAVKPDGAFINEGPLRWVARNSSKPGRDANCETWVLHASPEWSEAHWDDSPGSIADALWHSWCELLGVPGGEPLFSSAHRWRYALCEAVYPAPYVLDPQQRLAACGDWCGGPRVEGAFLSGLALAERIIDEVK